MEEINATMRGVNVVEDTEGSIKYQSNKPLCGRCGYLNDCEFTKDPDLHPVNECRVFRPVLVFRPPIRGFDTDGFNTIRLGVAWCRRVQPNSIVSLMNNKTREIFMHATVTLVDCGDKTEICQKHAINNHLYRDTETDAKIAGDKLVANMRNIYGNLINQCNTMATVIYLKRASE